eukprot:gnl/Spiro4/6659_TR3438_c0_g1_i1.p1 gnl/Spiro4/6659_TR3438_c0_g1~~gnl/Spiro4/6659_TR3438_c0_g1_i1.p1  ORF type:complete len:456 (+),score=43.05 gnl/Spiro4/6659_TR3438_c0_g1_i1:179-1546(+)
MFSYAAFMVIDFGISSDVDKVGLYAGLLGSAYFFGQLLSSYAWGVLADRFGKRPTLMLGSLGQLVASICFGLSRSFWWAVGVRGLLGLLNGNLGIAKAYLGSIATKKTQARLFGLIGISWAVGTLIGNFYGGVLARPAIQYPSVFAQNGVFGYFPYLLPNLVSSFVLTVALVVSWMWLTEPAQAEILKTHHKPGITSVLRQGKVWLVTGLYGALGFSATLLDELIPVWAVSTVEAGGLLFDAKRTGIVNALAGLMSLIVLLFIYQPLAGHLSMVRSFRIGILVYAPSVLLFPLLNLVLRAGAPMPLLWFLLAIACFVRAVASQFSFSSIFVLITNSVPHNMMGAAHGLGQSLVALMRVISPFFAGAMYAWSVSSDPEPHPFPLNYWLMFIFQSVCYVVIFGVASFLDPQMDCPPVVAQEVELTASNNQQNDDSVLGDYLEVAGCDSDPRCAVIQG